MSVLSRRIEDAAGLLAPRGSPPSDVIFFGGGMPDRASYPKQALAGLLGLAASEDDGTGLNYGYERGDPHLRDLIAARLRRQGGEITADHIVLTNGSAGAIGLACAALLDAGDVVIVEEATYAGALKAFRHHGAQIEVVPMDRGGMQMPALENLLSAQAAAGRRVKMVYTIATCHNPFASTLNLERRCTMLALASQHGVLAVEDYTYGEIRFQPAPPPLVALDASRAIQLGSFSKTIAPGLRTGWVAADPTVAAAIAEVRTDLGTSPLLQRAIAGYIDSGAYDEHLVEVTALYRRKRDRTLASLSRHCGAFATWNEPQGGFFVWLEFPAISLERLMAAAQEEKVAFIPGPYFAACPGSFGHNLRLAYGELNEDEIEDGVCRLGKAFARAAS